MGHCLKGCNSRRLHRLNEHRLALLSDQASERTIANRVGMSLELSREYAAQVAHTSLKPPPTFELYDNLRGVGGLFIGDQWAIVVGVDDMRQIAAAMLQNWGRRLHALCLAETGRWPQATDLNNWLVWEATKRCIAHELGHALIFSGANNPYYADHEAGADYYAGRLGAARGHSLEIGKMFFEAIGCVGDFCIHPDPASRAAAYERGYVAQARGVGT